MVFADRVDAGPCSASPGAVSRSPSEELEAAVFEMFARATGGTAGLGIGLAVCARVVAAHGGRIWIEGSPTGGTTVQVLLPARQPSSAT